MSDPRMIILTKSFRELGVMLGRKFNELAATQKDESMKQMRVLAQAVAQLDKPSDIVSVSVDTAKLETQVDQIKKQLKEQKAPDLQPILFLLGAVKSAVDDLKKGSKEESAQLLKALKALSFPKEIKLDDMQLRSIRSGGMTLAPLTLGVANSATIYNLTLTTANAQDSYTFPSKTVSWTIKARAQNAKIYYAWATGKLPASGDGTAYMSVPQNYLHSTDGVDYGGKTIYLQSDVAGTVVEIESFQSS